MTGDDSSGMCGVLAALHSGHAEGLMVNPAQAVWTGMVFQTWKNGDVVIVLGCAGSFLMEACVGKAVFDGSESIGKLVGRFRGSTQESGSQVALRAGSNAGPMAGFRALRGSTSDRALDDLDEGVLTVCHAHGQELRPNSGCGVVKDAVGPHLAPLSGGGTWYRCYASSTRARCALADVCLLGLLGFLVVRNFLDGFGRRTRFARFYEEFGSEVPVGFLDCCRWGVDPFFVLHVLVCGCSVGPLLGAGKSHAGTFVQSTVNEEERGGQKPA